MLSDSLVCKSASADLVDKPSPCCWSITEFIMGGIKEALMQLVPPEERFRNLLLPPVIS